MSVGEAVEKGNPCALLVGMQTLQPLWKAVHKSLKKLKMELPYEPVISLLGIYPKKPKTLIQKNICTPVFIVVLFFHSQDMEATQVPINK